MIQIEHTDVHGFQAAIRGMRNPMNSWDKSDSVFAPGLNHGYWIGAEDERLMRQLVKAGSDHSKFMRMIIVTCDITAPMYWWKEMDTYKVGTVRNSCSTMHTIHKKRFELDDFSHEHLIEDSRMHLLDTIEILNECRYAYIDYERYKREGILIQEISSKEDLWWQMIQLLPSTYNQKATWQANYAVLRNIYHARKNHKLSEWHDFCRWIESLPYSYLITD